ncbi:MAG: pantetheine-phosphate adenylyltransferase [Bacilli bacterium]
MKIAIYPGSFDPVTNGHLDIIRRATKVFDKLFVCVAINPGKKSFFSVDERVQMMKEACASFDNVEVVFTADLIVRKAKELGANVIVRGLRAVTDFEFEFQLAAANEYADSSIETVFMMASTGKGFISSSTIKEFYKSNVDITPLVPASVVKMFQKK